MCTECQEDKDPTVTYLWQHPIKNADEPCSRASPASPNQSNRAFNQSSAPAPAWQERCKHKLSHRPLSYPRQPWDLEEPQPFKCSTKLSPRSTLTNTKTTPSGAFSYPGNSGFLLIPTFHHEIERERECDKGGTMHILSFRQQTPFVFF